MSADVVVDGLLVLDSRELAGIAGLAPGFPGWCLSLFWANDVLTAARKRMINAVL
jgi:hypothetical protein